jgi:hypothetical protein
MAIGVMGFAEGRPDDPFEMVAAILDQPVLTGPVHKDRREDLQLWSALHALTVCGVALHPLGVSRGDDPPDRWLFRGDRKWGVELTELTIEDVRQDLSLLRAVARELRGRVLEREADFAHLRGRLVVISKDPALDLPRDHGQLLTDLETLLATDQGFVGEGQDLGQGPPKQLGTRGLYGKCGPFDVVANRNTNSNDIVLSAASPTTIYRSEAIEALGRRVAAKDHGPNEVLIVTCGLPDPRGYTCPADQTIFHLLWLADQAGVPLLPTRPTHLRGVLVHWWSSPLLITWESHDVPWTVPASS